MTYFIKNGNIFRPTDESHLDIHNEMPAGNYVIKVDANGIMYFEIVDNFEFKSKRYGSNEQNTNRILSTFLSRENSTGVVLTGEKGSGKSLLAKTVCMEAAEQGITTIIINAAYRGDGFNTLIQQIEQPAIVLFDEFEKVYDREEQEDLLTLFDGVFPSKKLFIITCNDKWRIDDHMRNRPGRVFYMIQFYGIEPEFIKEYCEDNLKNKSHIKKICNISTLFSQFNFDMLKALVEEMNRYDETPEQALKILNVRPEFSADATYTVELKCKGKILNNDERFGIPKEWMGNPLKKAFELNHYTDKTFKKVIYSKFTVDDIVEVDSSSGSFSFENASGNELKLTKVMMTKAADYFDMF